MAWSPQEWISTPAIEQGHFHFEPSLHKCNYIIIIIKLLKPFNWITASSVKSITRQDYMYGKGYWVIINKQWLIDHFIVYLKIAIDTVEKENSGAACEELPRGREMRQVQPENFELIFLCWGGLVVGTTLSLSSTQADFYRFLHATRIFNGKLN